MKAPTEHEWTFFQTADTLVDMEGTFIARVPHA